MKRLSGLDALRGVAAIMVMFLHASFQAGDKGLFAAGYLAVDLFFMLSGFVLARTFDSRLRSDLSTVDFMVLRVRRMWPMMAIGAALGYFSFSSTFGPTAAIFMLVTSLVFVPQRLQSDLPAFPSNPPAWSILAELAANTAHALILVRLSCRSLAIIAASCLGSLMLLTPDLDRGVMTGEFALGLLRVGFGYTLGVLLWRVWGDRALMRPTTALVALPALILLGSQLGGWYDFLFVALLCPLIILCCLGESKAGTFLGPLSFPLYAVHYPVTHWVIIVMGGPAWLAASLAILVSAPLALFFEPAGRRWARKRFKQSLQVGAEPASNEI